MIKNYKQFNESLRDKLVGPSEDEIWNNIKDLSPDKILKKCSKIGFFKGVEIALERGADIEIGLIESLKEKNKDIFVFLIKKGGDISIFDDPIYDLNETIDTLLSYGKSYNDLKKLYTIGEKFGFHLNTYLDEEYPFHIPFCELIVDDWVESCINSMNEYITFINPQSVNDTKKPIPSNFFINSKEEFIKKLIEGLYLFTHLQTKLSRQFAEFDGEYYDCNDFIIDDYPYELSFDEMSIDEWVEVSEEKLNKELNKL